MMTLAVFAALFTGIPLFCKADCIDVAEVTSVDTMLTVPSDLRMGILMLVAFCPVKAAIMFAAFVVSAVT